MNWQQSLPAVYGTMTTAEICAQIAQRKKELGQKLVILGHHYQQDDVIQFADVVGDSFQLSRDAAKQTNAEYVVFCGVYFMAESADVLTAPEQKVILPDLGAGCSMADMAQLEDVEEAWSAIHNVCKQVADFKLVPITYMNSSAAIKSFVGQHGGVVCTSSNCEKILRWALDLGAGKNPAGLKIIFFPDQHLGRNTAFKMGYPLEKMAVWDYQEPNGGLTDAEIQNATFLLWKGHCSVHQLFKPEHVDEARVKFPGCKVIVHPECSFEVVQKSDLSGSTDLIGKTIAAAPAGGTWIVGTEVHMVHRLAKEYPDKRIIMLSECQCLCTTMYRIDPPHLLWALDELAAGRVVNQIKVDEETAQWARVSLQRMLDITSGTQVAAPAVTVTPKEVRAGKLRVVH